jgi:putative toxin-antitoxin system antitoxin component (TIGR02293 family)
MATTEKLNLKELNISIGEAESILEFLYTEKSLAGEFQTNEPLTIIEYLRNGLPKAGIDNFLDKTSISRNQLSHILHISNRQLNRYEADDRLSPEQSNFLYELTRIYTRAIEILGDKATAEHWLKRNQLALGDKVPLAILDTSEGMRLVDHLLSQIEYGFYS